MVGHARKIPDCPLPCREKQFEEITSFIRDNISQQISRCMYVSGVPGTGKTVIVQAVVDELKAHYKELQFNHLYINGLTLGSRPDKLWKKMYKGLLGEKATPKQALSKLIQYFETRDTLPTVLVVDELDQLMDKSQSVLYRLLEWTTNPIAKFSFIAIFNTMNLPESALVNRNSSRMGFSRVVFPPYDHTQLRQIVERALLKQPSRDGIEKFQGDALTLLSRKVAAISGDARRALEIAKRTLEIMETSDPGKPGARCVDEAFKELFSSPKIETIRDCSTLEKTVLEAITSELNRTGMEETCLDPVQRHILAANAFEGMDVSVDNIIAAITRLAALKLVIVETSLPFFYTQTKLSLNVPLEDVKYALAQRDNSS